MSAFTGSASAVVELARQGTLATRIADQIMHQTWQTPSRAEFRSWEKSLPILAHDLLDAGLGDVEVLIEYQLPLTSKRADVVLAGVDPTTGQDSFVIVELKQWSRAELWEEDPRLVLVDNVPGGPKLHPGLQVRGYCEYAADFLGALAQHDRSLGGAAYLHNAADLDVTDLFDLKPDEWSRLYTRQRRNEFLDYLKSRLAPESGAGAANRLRSSAVRPSKNLMALAAAEIKEREQFVLLDEQRLAYEVVRHAVVRARRSDHKTAVIVTGGPGSGKSAIALSLLGELARHGYPAVHATGSRSFTQTLRQYAGRGSSRLKSLFKYFNSFMAATPNDLDVVICDEAHRIRRTSVNRFTRKEMRDGDRPQVDELISAARVPVFLLDEHQVVKPDETGTVDTIHEHAAQRGLDVEVVHLREQFRCGGSRAYEDWVLDLLDLSDRGPQRWPGDDRFELQVAGTPWVLEEMLRAKQEKTGGTARMSAGYCWPWSDPREDGSLVGDVTIGDWNRPWNLRGDRSVGDAPASAFWATDPRGIGQVGCVYTAQGFEYDWSGVILGPDIVARDGHLVVRREYNKDPSLRGRKATDADFDRLVRNVYKVLLTRGMRGTVLYATDAETREFLTALTHRTTPDERR
ncbi:DUF2075 domain-containing protein [Actinocatenispora rupis]|uniref:ATP-binding protein n=1 Tax=Actinocatenispora rupis TaxID=519421 RepID=A0A8J3NDR1_9ACTN|nr:DUF2075 domain-containing protein [Actinocatenispora rupis]GID15291.1 ATP-binding protein [Actinocatenispora rupis]